MKTNKKQEVKNIIEILSLRKKRFVYVDKSIFMALCDELDKNYPNAKFKFFGGVDGGTYNVIRTSAAHTFKCVGAK